MGVPTMATPQLETVVGKAAALGYRMETYLVSHAEQAGEGVVVAFVIQGRQIHGGKPWVAGLLKRRHPLVCERLKIAGIVGFVTRGSTQVWVPVGWRP